MPGKIIAATAAILVGTAVTAAAQTGLVFPQTSYWYGHGYYSPQTGTGFGYPPLYNVPPQNVPPQNVPPRFYDYAPGYFYHGASDRHGWSDDSWDRNWWKCPISIAQSATGGRGALLRAARLC